MTTNAISTAQAPVPSAGPAASITHREWARRALHRRTGRIWGLLLVLALLLPLLVTSLLGGH
jgi:cobalamin biosynthesis protein CobD/CbiB